MLYTAIYISTVPFHHPPEIVLDYLPLNGCVESGIFVRTGIHCRLQVAKGRMSRMGSLTKYG